MPGFNQTGPSGRGPMPGKGRGFCKSGTPVDETGIPRRAGLGRGVGFGRGFRFGPGPEMRGFRGRGLGRNRGALLELYPEDAYVEIDMLKRRAESIRHTLDAMNQRLSGLEKSE